MIKVENFTKKNPYKKKKHELHPKIKTQPAKQRSNKTQVCCIVGMQKSN